MNEITVKITLQEILETTFIPDALEVLDQSHLHKGHAGARPEGETHFKVRMISSKFEGLSRIKRHQLVHEALEELLKSRIHALTLQLISPGEI